MAWAIAKETKQQARCPVISIIVDFYVSNFQKQNTPLPKCFTNRKLKMSAVFIFEIKGLKKDKIFNFLKRSFSVIDGPMDMIFDVFSETYVRFLKSITLQLFFKI